MAFVGLADISPGHHDHTRMRCSTTCPGEVRPVRRPRTCGNQKSTVRSGCRTSPSLAPHARHMYMCVMNWGAFDLNLLIVFDAVMQDRSITRAGQRIGLSQPAMSHALNRLRYMLKDDLFVRTPEG